MKNILSSVVIVIAMFFAINDNSYSQSCSDCSATVTWTEAQDPIVSDILGCYFLINYRYKVCDDGTRLIELRGIEFIPGFNCAILTPTILINQAIRAVLHKSASLFQIQNPNIPFDVTVRTKKCWANNGLELNICDSSECCNTQYTLRYIEENYGNYVLTEEPITDNTIPQCTARDNPNSCIYICDAHYIPPYEPLYQRTYPSACSTNCNREWLRLDENYVSFQMGNCSIRVYYDIKDCRETYPYIYEFKIYLTRLYGDCNIYSNGEIIKSALKKILRQIYLRDFDSYVFAFIRAVTNHCFQRFNGLNDEKFIINCQYVSNCCIKRYKLREINGQVRLDSVYNESGQLSTCGVYSLCYSLCDTFNLEYPQILQKHPAFDLNELVAQDIEIKVHPNPADNKLTFSIHNISAKKLIIAIYNAIGAKYDLVEIEKPELVLIKEINTTNYLPGIYFYKVIADGVDMQYDSFIILR